MQYTTLGKTDLRVSTICLGSMTWGSQNTLEEGHAQIDMALDHGVNFVDTAEIYPVSPITKETAGDTEAIIGDWFAKTGRRDDVVLASKISGPNGGFVRGGDGFSGKNVAEAVDGSLKRLKTDYIDLYQLHWPVRGSYCFRQNWDYDPSSQDRSAVLAHMEEVLDALKEQVDAGKLRYVGLSNETAWGTSQWLRLAEDKGLPRMETIQNEYSLLHRMYDTDLGELGHNEQVTLLAYSPLATGLLSGKYQRGKMPAGSRGTRPGGLGQRFTPRAMAAIETYLDIAERHGLNPTQMANAFVLSRPFPAVTIPGATSLEQLEQVLPSADLTLSPEVLAEIAQAHRRHPMPF